MIPDRMGNCHTATQVVDMDRLDALTLRQLQSFVGATGVTSESPDPDEDPDADDADATVLWPQVLTPTLIVSPSLTPKLGLTLDLNDVLTLMVRPQPQQCCGPRSCSQYSPIQ